MPVVFTLLGEPVDLGALASLVAPGSNLTGFADFEGAPLKRWLELLAACVPGLRPVALIAGPKTAAIRFVSASAQVVAIETRNVAAINNAIARVADEPNGSLAILPEGFDAAQLDAITAAAARHRLPTISSDRRFARGGGLISYGVDVAEIYGRAALYIDRILRGTRPSQLELGRPTMFDLVVNLRTARALGLNVPPSILARADEVIE